MLLTNVTFHVCQVNFSHTLSLFSVTESQLFTLMYVRYLLCTIWYEIKIKIDAYADIVINRVCVCSIQGPVKRIHHIFPEVPVSE